jgi:hypothetical protein
VRFERLKLFEKIKKKNRPKAIIALGLFVFKKMAKFDDT